eukprot:TRINITY_DN65148_c0_g1_i1.p1 TRINITY_DN65148_c0_g1~~TRINITY_DN65148_c0_g1_i1.p1  ORF type:complete len:461 (-),score=102.05 TRINITY_DN65148_c0_g1_i1:84-1466(-)
MLSTLGQSVRTARRAAAKAALFGAGYGCHWTSTQEETIPQLSACAVASMWVGARGCVVAAQSVLPEGSQWLQQRLQGLADRDLRFLRCYLSKCVEQGVDSARLRSLVLRHVDDVVSGSCTGRDADDVAEVSIAANEVAEEAVVEEGLEESVCPRSTLSETVAFIHDNVVVLAGFPLDPRDASVVGRVCPAASYRWKAALAISGSLSTLISDDRQIEELRAEDIEQIAAAASASVEWLAAGRRCMATAAAATTDCGVPEAQLAPVKAELVTMQAESDEALERVLAVWKLLAAVPSTDAKRQVMATSGTLRRTLSAFPEKLPEPSAYCSEAFLPQELLDEIGLAASGRGSRRPGRWKKLKGGVASEAASLWRVEWHRYAEYGAWLAIIGIAGVAVSKDGLGYLPFHVVPEPWRAVVQETIFKRGVQVEELLSKDASPPPPPAATMADSMMLGTLRPQSDFIS